MPSNTFAIICVCARPIVSIVWLTTILCIISCDRGTPAMRRASASAASSSPAAGTATFARPHAAAVAPSIVSPVNISSFARIAPSR